MPHTTEGNTRLIRPLLEHGYDPEVKDRWGRTALDVACLQQWTPVELIDGFGAAALEYCTKSGALELRRPAGEPFVYTAAGGGYQTPAAAAAIPSTCDFDIVMGMTTAEFQHTYGARVGHEFSLEDTIGAHACSLQVTNGSPRGCPLSYRFTLYIASEH
jgi:hypothetical protein